jgi:hypothetical protein
MIVFRSHRAQVLYHVQPPIFSTMLRQARLVAGDALGRETGYLFSSWEADRISGLLQTVFDPVGRLAIRTNASNLGSALWLDQ